MREREFRGILSNALDSAIDAELRERSSSDPGGLTAAQRRLNDLADANGLTFEGRLYPVSIRPVLLAAEQARALRGIAEEFVRCLDVVMELYSEDSRASALFSVYNPVRDIALALPAWIPLVQICRLDGFVDNAGRYKILETNTACPGGVIQTRLATSAWAQTPDRLGAQVGIDYSCQSILASPSCFVASLIQSHVQLRGTYPERAAVVTYKGRYSNEVDRIVAGLEALGVTAQRADAARLQWDGVRLRTDTGEALDLVYNKLDPLDLLDEPRLVGYLASAVADAVTFVNPLAAQWVLE